MNTPALTQSSIVQDQVHRWQAERLQYQQEIHRLRAQAATVEEEAVPV